MIPEVGLGIIINQRPPKGGHLKAFQQNPNVHLIAYYEIYWSFYLKEVQRVIEHADYITMVLKCHCFYKNKLPLKGKNPKSTERLHHYSYSSI